MEQSSLHCLCNVRKKQCGLCAVALFRCLSIFVFVCHFWFNSTLTVFFRIVFSVITVIFTGRSQLSFFIQPKTDLIKLLSLEKTTELLVLRQKLQIWTLHEPRNSMEPMVNSLYKQKEHQLYSEIQKPSVILLMSVWTKCNSVVGDRTYFLMREGLISKVQFSREVG